jgi:hypothetical protein
VELDKGRLKLAAVAIAVALSSCGGGDDGDGGRAALAKQFAREHRKAEKAVQDGRLPKEALQMFDSKGRIQSDFIGRPGSQDVVKEDTDGDGKPDRNLRFDLDRDGKVEPGERRITESRLFSALIRIVRPAELPTPGSDSGKSS